VGFVTKGSKSTFAAMKPSCHQRPVWPVCGHSRRATGEPWPHLWLLIITWCTAGSWA